MLDASTTGDCSSRLQDSELESLRVRVGVLEGALREALPLIANDVRGYSAALHADEVRRRVRAVLAGGEAVGQETMPWDDDPARLGGEAGKEKP